MKVTLGSISEGTLLTADLISTFASELEYYKASPKLTALSNRAMEMGIKDEAQSHLLESLFDALDEIAPPYAWFGASEGDGASFGFFPSCSQ